MNRYLRPIQFAFEPDVVSVFAKVSFGASGAPTLDTSNSKGICNIRRSSFTFVGSVTSDSSTAVTAVSSFAGLYVGMTVTGTGIAAGTTIASMNAGAKTLALSQNGNATAASSTITAVGGQYTIQFGTEAGVRLDAYNKLLGLSHIWDETGLPGTTTALAGIPGAPIMLLTANKIGTRTIPGTAASALTDCTLVVQFGGYTGTSGAFVAADPASGDILRLAVKLCRSSAI